jgi:UDP-glucuronate decarboxylase
MSVVVGLPVTVPRPAETPLVVGETKSSSSIVNMPLPQGDPRQRKPNISLAQEVPGWSPKVPLQEGLKSMIAYFNSNGLMPNR